MAKYGNDSSGKVSEFGLTERERNLMLLCLQEYCCGRECRTCKYRDAEDCAKDYICKKVKHLDMSNKILELDK